MSYTGPFESESPTKPNPSSSCQRVNDLVVFPPVCNKNLIRLREDLLRASSALPYQTIGDEHQYLSSISDLLSRDKTSQTDLSSAEATELERMFRMVSLPH